MECLQLSQVLADLGNLRAEEPRAAAAIVRANEDPRAVTSPGTPTISITLPEAPSPASDGMRSPHRPNVLHRAWSSEEPKVDKYGRRIMMASPTAMQAALARSSPGTPRRSESEAEDDLERASTLMALYDIRAKLKQQDNSSLIKAREKINALAARQQGQQPLNNNKPEKPPTSPRYSFPKSGL